MGIFSALLRFFGFTRRESIAILFLTASFIAGLLLRWYDAREASDPLLFDYSSEDSLFIELSRGLLSSGNEETPRTAPGRKEKQALLPESIDINTATKEDLMLLPGIGATYAERIAAYRETAGPFRSINDLEKVKGIGKKTMARIRPFLAPPGTIGLKKP